MKKSYMYTLFFAGLCVFNATHMMELASPESPYYQNIRFVPNKYVCHCGDFEGNSLPSYRVHVKGHLDNDRRLSDLTGKNTSSVQSQLKRKRTSDSSNSASSVAAEVTISDVTDKNIEPGQICQAEQNKKRMKKTFSIDIPTSEAIAKGKMKRLALLQAEWAQKNKAAECVPLSSWVPAALFFAYNSNYDDSCSTVSNSSSVSSCDLSQSVINAADIICEMQYHIK